MEYLGVSITKIFIYRIKHAIMLLCYYAKHAFPKRSILKETKKLKHINSGKKAFVFANGPSLKKLDASKIANYKNEGYHVFAVNTYILSDFSKSVKPDYYVLSDPAFFGNNYHLTEDQKKQLAKATDMLKESGAILFLPLEFHNSIDYLDKYSIFDGQNIFSKNVSNILKPRGYVSLTAYKALSIACFLGYDEIYICGFDNDYFKYLIADIDNKLYFEDVHFYDRDRPRRPVGSAWTSTGTVGETLYSLHFLFEDLKKFSSFNIINLDPESLTNCFKKHHKLDVYKIPPDLH